MRISSVSALLCLAFLTGACKAPRADTPETAYAAFAQKLLKSDAKGAYEDLSESTRQAIERQSERISSASGGAIRNEPALLTFATGVKARAVTEVKVVKQEEQVATVAVTAGGQTQEVRMVREGGRWKVDLSEIFKE